MKIEMFTDSLLYYHYVRVPGHVEEFAQFFVFKPVFLHSNLRVISSAFLQQLFLRRISVFKQVKYYLTEILVFKLKDRIKPAYFNPGLQI